MYRPHSDEPAPTPRSLPYRTFRCGHCGAWLVLRASYETPPTKCGRCHQ